MTIPVSVELMQPPTDFRLYIRSDYLPLYMEIRDDYLSFDLKNSHDFVMAVLNKNYVPLFSGSFIMSNDGAKKSAARRMLMYQNWLLYRLFLEFGTEFEGIRKNLIQSVFIDVSEATKFQRYIAYCLARSVDDGVLAPILERCILPGLQDGVAYVITTFVDLFDAILLKMIEDDCAIKICPNCGEYFIPRRSDSVYCDRASPQDDEKTCREYRRYYDQLHKSRTDDATKLHRQIYNKLRNRSNRAGGENQLLRRRVDDFLNESNEWRDRVNSGQCAVDDYIAWLKAYKEGG